MSADFDLLDPMTELIGMGIGRAADVLNSMLDSHITLQAPSLRIIRAEELAAALSGQDGGELSAVQMRYEGSVDGAVELIFTSGEAGKLVDCLVGEDNLEEAGLDAIRAGTLCEVGNIVINALLGTLSNALGLHLVYTVPAYLEGDASRLIADADLADRPVILLAETEFHVERRSINGKIAVFFSLSSFETLKGAVRTFAGISE